jgi:hypothetical protein
MKENFNPVDPRQTLEKLMTIPITQWNFKADDTLHIGPMAQDFYAAFGVGKDDKHLNPTDTTGVTIAAIQGLYQQNLELKAVLLETKVQLGEQIHEKDREIEDLNVRMAKLEILVKRLANLEKLSCGSR